MIIFRKKGLTKKEEIQLLKAGDLILINGNPRLLRKVKICRIDRSINYGYPYYYYFNKKKKSQYPCASVLLTLPDMMTLYGGLLKRDIPLFGSDKEAVLQYSIENDFNGNLSHNERARKANKYGMYMGQEESAGKYI